MVLRRTNMNPNDYVHCCVIGCHGNSLLHFVFFIIFTSGGIILTVRGDHFQSVVDPRMQVFVASNRTIMQGSLTVSDVIDTPISNYHVEDDV